MTLTEAYAGTETLDTRIKDSKPKRQDKLMISFQRNGAYATTVGYFHDFTHISDYGLTNSLREVPN